jgi:hypothetical protein
MEGGSFRFPVIIMYDVDFVGRIRRTLRRKACGGVIVHELAHAKQFMQDQTFTAYPHETGSSGTR